MGEIPMPGGWLLSMAWVPMCGQTWSGAALSFVGMWAAMMVAMMLPSLLPALWRHGAARGALAGAGYFFVWTALGAVVFAAGAAFAQFAMRMPALARAVPVSAAVVVLLAGSYQFTPSKARHLACCRPGSVWTVPAGRGAGTAWRQGVVLGVHCVGACAGLTATLLVVGVMDLRAMALAAAAITAERLAPNGERVAWVVGVATVAAGMNLLGQAAATW